jgi:hypothetical protein
MFCKKLSLLLTLCFAGAAFAADSETPAVPDASNQRPKRSTVGPRPIEVHVAEYFDIWRKRAMRIGNLNYPEEARGKISGSLIMTIVVRQNGDIEKITINRPAESQVLNDASLRIVSMVPFYSFNLVMARDLKTCTATTLWKYANDELTVTVLASRNYPKNSKYYMCAGVPELEG